MTETHLRSILKQANDLKAKAEGGGRPQRQIQWSTQKIVVFR